jgi:16S rRNA (cytosine967-C5)-methyltransferase
VKPGGRLVYITCSVFSAENADQIAGFVARSTAFQPIDHDTLWAKHFPGHQRAARIDNAGGISLTPARSGTDGFYFAAIRKQG